MGEARTKYPKQWIVAVNLTWEEGNKVYGDIYTLVTDKKEAYQIAKELRAAGDMGKVMVTEGFNDTPQIGGLEICVQS